MDFDFLLKILNDCRNQKKDYREYIQEKLIENNLIYFSFLENCYKNPQIRVFLPKNKIFIFCYLSKSSVSHTLTSEEIEKNYFKRNINFGNKFKLYYIISKIYFDEK